MPTKSFTREIRITKASAINKINKTIANNIIDEHTTSVRNIFEKQAENRKKLANIITKKY